MSDKPIIIAGLVVFCGLAAFPFWYTLGSAAYSPGSASPPELEPPAGALEFSAEWPEDDVDLESLRKELENHQISLSDEAKLSEEEQSDQWSKWRIIDKETRYLVLKMKNQETVQIYDGCVEDKDFMAANHMNLLIQWRQAVVRQADKSPIEINGEKYPKSLTKGCMKCHTSRENFCARCHEYMDVQQLEPLPELATAQQPQRGIRCWSCHVAPKGD